MIARRRTSLARAAAALLAVVAGAVVAAGAPATTPAPPQAPAPPDSPAPVAVSAVGITVSDLDRAVAFYTGVLGFEHVGAAERAGPDFERLTGVFGARAMHATLRLGDEQIELTQFLAPEGRPIPADSRSHDRWFQHIAIVVSDMDRAYAHLRAHRVRHASSGPQTLPDSLPAAAGIRAFYFKDPDGHVLEVIQFPAGKGHPRWHAPTERLFLGIDHTAIVVADTDASIRFYQGALGLRVSGASENYGSEQERLNNVFGARLRITTLAGAGGPAVELLEYLAPGDGRPMPPDSRGNDLWAWRTHVASPPGRPLTAIASAAQAASASWVSPGVIALAPESHAITLRDPDGHLVVASQPPPR